MINANRSLRCLLVVGLFALSAQLPAAQPAAEPSPRFHEIRAPDGVLLNVVETGPADAPAVIFVHGIGQSMLSWRKQLEGPLAQRFRLVALDLRGHGDSGKPADPTSYREACRWAEDLRAVQTQLGISKPVLVAWSFGGLVAMHYVRCVGTKDLAGLALVSTAAGRLVAPAGSSPTNGAKQAGAAARDMTSPDLRRNLAGARAFAALMTAGWPDEAWEAETLAALMRLPAYVRRAIGGEVFGPGGERLTSNVDLAPKLSLPLLVVIGGRDALSDGQALADAYTATFPKARVIVYPRAGHSPFAEDAARFDADLGVFIDRLTGPAPDAD